MSLASVELANLKKMEIINCNASHLSNPSQTCLLAVALFLLLIIIIIS
jgi:hypothetical protein